MKIIRQGTKTPNITPRSLPWKVLVVDDEPTVRQMTALNLKNFQFAGRGLELIEASSMAEAKALLLHQTGIALALIDVVMETDDAGLRLVEYIRNERQDWMMRLIIRTGQPGLAPERYVIDTFDIDDYKDKTELTVQKIYTTVRSALKSYRDLQTINANRLGLARILSVTPELYNLHQDHLEDYFQGLLIQIIGICNLEQSGLISTIDGFIATMEGKSITVRAGTGEFGVTKEITDRCGEIANVCSKVVLEDTIPNTLRQGAIIVPLKINKEVFGFIYLESNSDLTKEDKELIQVMANQCAAALDNFRLHHNLEKAYDEAVDMLGRIAEFKDSATGAHIQRIQEYTRRIAIALGCSSEEAEIYGKASRLHDVGKVGIPDNILRKPGKLTAEEFVTMRNHTRIGDAVLSCSPALAIARVVAKNHHERWDGTGYPSGLAGTDIPFPARIVAVVDVFDALVSQRSYKEAWSAKDAVTEIERGRNLHFDPEIVDVFLTLYRSGSLDDLVTAAATD